MKLRRGDSRGQALVMVTLALVIIFGLLGLAVDVGWAYYRREAAQAAADAAATAAVKKASEVGSPTCQSVWCGSTPGTPVNCPSTAPTSVSNAYEAACVLAAANGFKTVANKQRVSIQANVGSAPTVTGVAPVYYATVRVWEKAPGFFSGFAGQRLQPAARSTAAITSSGTGAGCIYVLDPNGNNAFSAGNGISVQSGCGIYVNSNANTSTTQAMYVTGGARVSATGNAQISVVGKYKQDNGGSTTPAPTTGVSPITDPFLTLPSLTPDSTCKNGNFTAWQQGGWYYPSAGTYCGMTVANGMNAQLGPGTYIINGGTFSIQGGSTVTANGGVMIYLTNGATVNIANGTNVTLTAQSSGVYQGILFYQDRAMSTPGTSYFAGGTNMRLSGALYFPKALLNIDNGSNVGQTMALVAYRVNFQGGARINAATSLSQTGINPSGGSKIVVLE